MYSGNGFCLEQYDSSRGEIRETTRTKRKTGKARCGTQKGSAKLFYVVTGYKVLHSRISISVAIR
ncbi:Activator Of 90 Kda Heat Shock Protein Atpase 2-Like [Manis pentadactyla]|nr:Activator Of 90 Kda Heat Shock Protein Atpase 2-Like [Manis pentadactyla]